MVVIKLSEVNKMKNTFEEAVKFLSSNDFEFIGLDSEANEIFYIHCVSDYEAIYKQSLEFAKRFIEIGCYSLAVKDLFFNDIALHIYKSELIHNNEYNEYSIACQIIRSIVEGY